MIEINLLPEELKIKTKGHSLEQVMAKGAGIFNPEQLFIYAIPALLGVFIFLHFVLMVSGITKSVNLGYLNQKWLASSGQRKELDDFNKDYSGSTKDANLVKLLNSQRILWAQKLNELSLNLPSGVWFNQILINSKGMVIQGSVISLQKEEVGLINKLLDNLKLDAQFSKDFSSFELSSVQKKDIGSYDIADFVLTATLRPR